MLALIAIVAVSLAQPPTQSAPPTALEKLRQDAAAVRPLVQHDCVRDFLDATSTLPEISPRTIYYQRDPKAAFTKEQADKLPQDQREKLREIPFDTAKYYDTFYGSPLA